MLPLRSLPPLALFVVLGCATPAPPSEAFVLAPISQAEREMQTRVFATEDERAVLAACIAVLQRHGFAAEDQDHALGVIVAFKDTEGGGQRTRLRASIASRPAGEFGLETQLRITFQRLAWNARGREILRQAVREPGEYDGFFEQLAQTLALPGASKE